MKITLNNNAEEFAGESMTISGLLKEKNFTFKMLVIKINGTLVKKTAYETAMVHDGDEVHVLHLISGG
ncbi:MAG: sulfur carrier protein ThiS [Bacteroidetes bacterium]|nr:sulfur carrier protein ThiS [Bacteroidota bacterium]